MESSQHFLVSSLYEELNYQAEVRNVSITSLPLELVNSIVKRYSNEEWLFFCERHEDLAFWIDDIPF